jgi:hypothetical protein
MEAVELLTLAVNHSSAWQDTIDNGGRLLAELEAALPPESFSAAWTRAESLTLEQAAKNVLQAEAKFLGG